MVIGNDDIQTKTSVRRRLLPAVLAIELIRAKLTAAFERAAKAADSAATPNKRLKKREDLRPQDTPCDTPSRQTVWQLM